MASNREGRWKRGLRSFGLVALGAVLAAAVAGAVVFAGGDRLLYRALGGDALARACLPSLVAALKERGFEPSDIEFGPDPQVGSPFARPRSFGARFTFRDGAAGDRVDGIVACAVSGEEVTVEIRVGAPPHRAA